MGNSWNDMWTVLWIGYRLIIYNYNRGSMETQIQTDMPRPSNFFNGTYGRSLYIDSQAPGQTEPSCIHITNHSIRSANGQSIYLKGSFFSIYK